ncbi:unnamed protein product [Orchesella dallaii]|uniref:Uncharacterized protein n=1 Tax=Orchesella dallaii TaxID=48710 RepID=A0ABP1RY74_9HEXA
MKHHFEQVILTEIDSSGRLVNSKLTQILVTKLGFACWKRDENFDIIGRWTQLLFSSPKFAYSLLIIIILNKFKSFWPRQITNGSAKTQSTYTWTNSMDFEGIQKLRKKLENSTIPTILENAFISAAKDILPAGRLPEQLNIGELAALFPYPNRYLQNRFAIFTSGINSLQNDFDRIRASKEESWNDVTGPWIPLLYFIFKLSGRMPVFIHHMILRGGSTSLMMSNFPISKTKSSVLAGEAI